MLGVEDYHFKVLLLQLIMQQQNIALHCINLIETAQQSNVTEGKAGSPQGRC